MPFLIVYLFKGRYILLASSSFIALFSDLKAFANSATLERKNS